MYFLHLLIATMRDIIYFKLATSWLLYSYFLCSPSPQAFPEGLIPVTEPSVVDDPAAVADVAPSSAVAAEPSAAVAPAAVPSSAEPSVVAVPDVVAAGPDAAP